MNKFNLFLMLTLVAGLGFLSYKFTLGFFSDTETSTTNTFQAAASFGTPSPTATPSATPTPTPTPAIANHLVVNEIYYDPDSAHMQGRNPDENDFEWVEIYNPTGLTVNLKDWKIVDDSGTERTISHSNSDLVAGGFVVLSKSAPVKNIWGLSNDQFIAIGQIFGDGLSNIGDRIILKDAAGNIIDQMSYGTDNTILNPSATDVIEGHSLERNPDGNDTNSAADFVDRNPPTPGT